MRLLLLNSSLYNNSSTIQTLGLCSQNVFEYNTIRIRAYELKVRMPHNRTKNNYFILEIKKELKSKPTLLLKIKNIFIPLKTILVRNKLFQKDTEQ